MFHVSNHFLFSSLNGIATTLANQFSHSLDDLRGVLLSPPPPHRPQPYLCNLFLYIPFAPSTSHNCESLSLTTPMATISSGAILGIVELQGDLDPWQVAKCRFLEGLDEAEKALFEDATVGNTFLSACVAERKDAADNKLRSFLPKIQPLVSAVEGYGNAFDTYSNFASLYLAPIWGRVRVLLAIASSYGRFYSRLVDALGRIGDVLPRFRKCLPYLMALLQH